MDANQVSFPGNAGDTAGYLEVPSSGSGPGVIVLQEWWGLVPHIEDVCRRFAAEGFVALAPDLYHGKSTTSPDEAGKLFMALNIDRTEQDLRGAVAYLQQHPAVTGAKVGCVGFCMGGQLSLFAAGANPAIGACVDYYGIHPNVNPDYASIQGPVLGFFGGKDGSVGPEKVAALETTLRAAGKTVETHTYPNADHAFFNDTRPEAYQAEAAADSWSRMLKLFRAELSV